MEEVEPRHGLQWFRGQVPNGLSGVLAGTYGDSLNVGQFTVNALGIITFAQNVPIGFPAQSDASSGTTINIGIKEYATPDADQVTIALALNNISYNHGLGGVPHSVRWVAIPQADIGGYVAGEEIPLETFEFNGLSGGHLGVAGPRIYDDTIVSYQLFTTAATDQTVGNKDTWNKTAWTHGGTAFKVKAYAIL